MTSVQIIMGAALICAVIVLSKLFCSFVCPLGAVSEWIGKAGDRFRIRININADLDIILRGIKYALLFLVVYFTVTSSELFCRKFDPYFAIVSGFNSDVSPVWATIAIIVLVSGSFLLRLFWCRYVCPVSALSNIFIYAPVFASVVLLWIILGYAGVVIGFVWPLAIVCTASYTIEFLTLKNGIFPLLKIRRDTSLCTNCGLCTNRCPYSIEVDKVTMVQHIDCHMCTDCINACPEKGALTIGKKGKKWIPPFAVIFLAITAIFISSGFEIPTINQYWGAKENRGQVSEFSKSGLKSVKCYGSSLAFAGKMKSVTGIEGVATYVKTNTVRILYSPQVTDTLTILRSIFTPSRVSVREPGPEVSLIAEYIFYVDNFFDPIDAVYLKEILSGRTDIYGFSTTFDCPVKINVYFEAGSDLSTGRLTDIIQGRDKAGTIEGGNIKISGLKYIVKKAERSSLRLGRDEYISRFGSVE
jgi:NAD-dependent dihydropyrimidine dehydrogenase PreA subunit